MHQEPSTPEGRAVALEQERPTLTAEPSHSHRGLCYLRTMAHALDQDYEFPRSKRWLLGRLFVYLSTVAPLGMEVTTEYMESLAKCLAPFGTYPLTSDDLTNIALLIYHFLDMCDA